MASWREQVLKEFTASTNRLTIAIDPDDLLVEEVVLQEIKKRGFDIITYEDQVSFRFLYESKYRAQWDTGHPMEFLVVLRTDAPDIHNLPYDLVHSGRTVSLSLSSMFPNLSYPVVAAMDRGDLDALFFAQVNYSPGTLGENATKDFILRHVFDVAPELIKSPSDLLRVLLQQHYRHRTIPLVFCRHFIKTLGHGGRFKDWPLDQIVPDRESFFAFLQERWPVYLSHFESQADSVSLVSDAHPYFSFSGPTLLPFEHDNVRGFIDNLFAEGFLKPVVYTNGLPILPSWAQLGIVKDIFEDHLERLGKLTKTIEETLPPVTARHPEWLNFASLWAQFLVLRFKSGVTLHGTLQDRIRALTQIVDKRFCEWVLGRYSHLANLPPVPPVMVHQIARFMARKIEGDNKAKMALIVIDGLAIDQWIVLREEIQQQMPDLPMHEENIFAWLPTITSVSRQSIFAGKPPLFFPSSIDRIDQEPALWSSFWMEHGIPVGEVTYLKNLGTPSSIKALEELLDGQPRQVVGLVIDTVDKIMHGMVLGTAGMHNQVLQWAREGTLVQTVHLLLEKGYDIFITSDHGNIEATGCGWPKEGAVADQRGERVRIYSDKVLRETVKKVFPTAINGSEAGLPEQFYPLFAPNRQAFIQDGQTIVGHGGISIEELIVPLIQIEKRNK
jgi:hypothetical protein